MRRGRREEFSQFSWTPDIADPQSEDSFLCSKLNWELQTEGRHRILWLFYQELLRLRRDVPALARLDKNTQEISSFRDEKTLLLRRWDGSSSAIAAFHFSEESRKLTLPIPPGPWLKQLDSADERWAGKGSQAPAKLESTGEIHLTFGPWNFLLLEQTTKANK